MKKHSNGILDRTHFSHEWKELYKAIANFKNKEALELLYRPFTGVKHKDIREYHLRFIFYAIIEFKIDLYDELFFKLWKEEDYINIDVFNYLYKKYPKQAYELAESSLQRVDEICLHSDVYSEIENNEENIIDTLLDIIYNKNKEKCIEIIKYNISDINVHYIEIFTKRASNLKHKSFVNPLFKRLRTEDNAHVYIELIKALISYKDENINEKLLEMRKINKELNIGWGKDVVDNLFEANDIK